MEINYQVVTIRIIYCVSTNRAYGLFSIDLSSCISRMRDA